MLALIGQPVLLNLRTCGCDNSLMTLLGIKYQPNRFQQRNNFNIRVNDEHDVNKKTFPKVRTYSALLFSSAVFSSSEGVTANFNLTKITHC